MSVLHTVIPAFGVQVLVRQASARDGGTEDGCGGSDQHHALQSYLPGHGQYWRADYWAGGLARGLAGGLVCGLAG